MMSVAHRDAERLGHVDDRLGLVGVASPAPICCYAAPTFCRKGAHPMSHRSSGAIFWALAAFAASALLPPAAAQPVPAGNKPDVTLGSTPDTVIWGYFSARVPPVLRIKSGTTVRIDTMSHQGLVTSEDPVTYFGKAGIKPDEVLQDAKDIYAK